MQSGVGFHLLILLPDYLEPSRNFLPWLLGEDSQFLAVRQAGMVASYYDGAPLAAHRHRGRLAGLRGGSSAAQVLAKSLLGAQQRVVG